MSAADNSRAVDGRAVASRLQPVLVDLIALGLNGKQAHWHVRGRHFTPLHEQLDTLVGDARTYADDVAERLVALGVAVDGRAQTVAESSGSFPEGFLDDDKVIALIVDELEAVIERARETLDDLEELDLISQDLVIELVKVLEKHRWMFAAQKEPA
jgi:starvation-inducible DNA-binding protein